MHLIIESGATKSNWVILESGQLCESQKYPGINVTSNPDSVLIVNEYSSPLSQQINKINFYGAGLASPDSQAKLHTFLQNKFEKAQIRIDTDILAACIAVSPLSPSIVSILGTGVNTVLFNGEQITAQVRSLGYLISDKGSGYNIGRLIVDAFYKNKMSTPDSKLFRKNYIEGKSDLIPRIYASSKPNYEIAQFSKFLDVSSTELRKQILNKNFKSFFEKQILAIKDSQNYKLTFVGAIASYFAKELEEAAHEYKFEIENIIKDPLDGLIAYHNKRNG